MQLLQVFSLFRWVNQAVIILTLYLLQYCLIHPLFPYLGILPTLDDTHFALLVLSIVLIAGAGYLINDYFDVNADTINKSEKVKIGLGKPISQVFAMRSYITFNLIGIGLGFYVGWKVGNYKLGYIHVLVAALLWFYATTLKRKLIIGNFVVSFIIALCVLQVAFFDENLLQFLGYQMNQGVRSLIEGMGYTLENTTEAPSNVEGRAFIMNFIGGYAFFAFLLNFIREIVKDIEDVEGDKRAGYRTLPIVGNIGIAKLVAAALCLVCLNYLIKFLANQVLLEEYIPAVAGTLLVVLPLMLIVVLIWRAYEIPKDFKRISWIVKGVMLAGLLYLPYTASNIGEPVQPTVSFDELGITDVQIDTTYEEQLEDTTALETIPSNDSKGNTDEILEFGIDKDSIPDNLMDLLKQQKQ